MRNVTTDALSIDVPDIFEFCRKIGQSIRAEHRTDDDAVDLSVALSDEAPLPKHAGADRLDRYRAFCQDRRGPARITEDRDIEIDGRTGRLLMAKAESGYAFLFVYVPLTDDVFIDVVGDCPAPLAGEWFPVYLDVLRSLRCVGDPDAAMAEHRALIAHLLGPASDDENPEPKAPPAPPFAVPADGQPYFEIDDISVVLGECDAVIPGISNVGNDLNIEIKGQVPDFDEDEHGHVLNDYRNGEVSFRVSVRQVYDAAAPRGRFVFEEDRDTSGIAYLWKDGFHYSLSFQGEVVLEDGWVGVSGSLQAGDDAPAYPIRAGWQLPLEELDWQHYRFDSMEEIERATPELPRHLHLNDLADVTLPDALYRYTNLESLSVGYADAAKGKKGLKEIPAALSTLTALRELSFTNVARVKELPEALGDLQHLRRLYVSGSQVTRLPAEVARLPALTYCILPNNRIDELPEEFSPSLVSLSLEGNALGTVPASLTALPALTTLNLEDNPLTALPAGLEKVPTLRLALETKHALLDFSYQGAGGRGTVEFDDRMFAAEHDAALMRQLDTALADPAWTPYRSALQTVARKAVALATTEADDYQDRGNTRFGGLPDLPPGVDYPTLTTQDGETRGMQFIAQLDCAQLAPWQSFLPRTGVLYFFISDQEAFTPRVFHYDGASDALQSAASLSIDDDFVYDDHGVYQPYRAEAGPHVSVPHFYGDHAYYQGAATDLEALEEEYELTEALTRDLSEASAVKPIHTINGFVFKQHDTPELEAASVLRGRAEDFMVLLRVSSDSNTGFNFWDAGEIYFVIHKSDLAKGDFSNVHCGLESS